MPSMTVTAAGDARTALAVIVLTGATPGQPGATVTTSTVDAPITPQASGSLVYGSYMTGATATSTRAPPTAARPRSSSKPAAETGQRHRVRVHLGHHCSTPVTLGDAGHRHRGPARARRRDLHRCGRGAGIAVRRVAGGPGGAAGGDVRPRRGLAAVTAVRQRVAPGRVKPLQSGSGLPPSPPPERLKIFNREGYSAVAVGGL